MFGDRNYPFATANDIRDPRVIEKLIHLWKYDPYNDHMKTFPCDKGKECKTTGCRFAHATCNDEILLRCRNCANRTCRHSTLHRTTMNVRGKSRTVLKVCRGLVQDLEDREHPPQPQHHQPSPEVLRAMPPVELPEDQAAAILEELYPTGENTIPNPKKRERSADEEQDEPEDDLVVLRPTNKTYQALVNMIRNPDFKGAVQIPKIYLLETLKRLKVSDVASLDPNTLPDTVEMRGFLKNAELMNINMQLREQIRMYEDAAARKASAGDEF